MKKCIITSALLLIVNSVLFPQYRISLNPGFGYYASNSENALRMMENQKKYRSYFSFGLSFQKDDFFGISLMLDYSYNHLTRDNLVVFGYSDMSPIEYSKIHGGLKLSTHSIDIAYLGTLTRNFHFGIGPSFIITSRTYESEAGYGDGRLVFPAFQDRLASSGLGINVFMMYNTPLIESFYLTSKIKLRYAHSIWFDKGPRNLDNYSQEFVTPEVSVGLGYAF